MELQEIMNKVASHMVSGMMFHEQMSEYYLFLNLKGYSKCHEYHFMDETCNYRKFCKFYTKHFQRLIHTDIEVEQYIPESWYKYTRFDVDKGTVQESVKKGLEMWVDWERKTKKMYQEVYTELVEANEIDAAIYMEKLVRCVSKELEKVESYHIKKTIIDYNISDIMAEQHHKKEKYKGKIKEMVGDKMC